MSALEQALLARLKASEAQSVAFLQSLLRHPAATSTVTEMPGDTRPAAAVVLGALRGAGFDPAIIAPQADMPNIVARFDAPRPGRHLVLNGHMDVFPAADHEWSRNPWSGEIVDGRIHGRGACDMKEARLADAGLPAPPCAQRQLRDSPTRSRTRRPSGRGARATCSSTIETW
jgi:acetylornithine deacetylase/succinyl-diaminopimelate desuccinylase-like protein